ncbi:hypothetical protein V1477_007336 [Vespula maculifrons]|uniref:Uncharacterized protein n=1 Tax=Vespula maculifrons TaxID=7453 RepID=A0ABD2CJB8_VESMC
MKGKRGLRVIVITFQFDPIEFFHLHRIRMVRPNGSIDFTPMPTLFPGFNFTDGPNVRQDDLSEHISSNIAIILFDGYIFAIALLISLEIPEYKVFVEDNKNTEKRRESCKPRSPKRGKIKRGTYSGIVIVVVRAKNKLFRYSPVLPRALDWATAAVAASASTSAVAAIAAGYIMWCQRMLRRASRLGGTIVDIAAITVLLVTRTTSTSLDSLNRSANVTSDYTATVGGPPKFAVVLPPTTLNLRLYELKFSRPLGVVCGKPNG